MEAGVEGTPEGAAGVSDLSTGALVSAPGPASDLILHRGGTSIGSAFLLDGRRALSVPTPVAPLGSPGEARPEPHILRLLVFFSSATILP